MRNIKGFFGASGAPWLLSGLALLGCQSTDAVSSSSTASTNSSASALTWSASTATKERLNVASWRLTDASGTETVWEGLSDANEALVRAHLTRPSGAQSSLHATFDLPVSGSFDVDSLGKVTGDAPPEPIADALAFGLIDLPLTPSTQSPAAAPEGDLALQTTLIGEPSQLLVNNSDSSARSMFLVAANCIGVEDASYGSAESPTRCQGAIANDLIDSGGGQSLLVTQKEKVVKKDLQWVLKEKWVLGLLSWDHFHILYVDSSAAEGREKLGQIIINNSGKVVNGPFNYAVSTALTVGGGVSVNVVKDILSATASFSFTKSDTLSTSVNVTGIKPGERQKVWVATVGERFTILRETTLPYVGAPVYSRVKFNAFVPTGIRLRPAKD